jgi:uncharacterized protein (DUF58 family)
MIVPTPRLALALAAGAPLALAVGLAAPALWWLALAWALLLALAWAVDAWRLGPVPAVVLQAPAAAAVGETISVTVLLPDGVPRHAMLALGLDARLGDAGSLRAPAAASTAFAVQPVRRGPAQLGPVDLAWEGPWRLARRVAPGLGQAQLLVTPDLRPAIEEAPRLIAQDALTGLAAQPWRGDAGDFDRLAAFQPGMDKRRIDWKASARHTQLLAKEYRTERDNNVILALDCGRLMMAEVAGLTRLDHAITAALLTGAVALHGGDRVGLIGFGARPHALLPPLQGPDAFARLQRAAATLDYGVEETNFALSLSTLASGLKRRSLVLLFTDFVDTTMAELMLRSLTRLLQQHLVLCITMDDPALAAVANARPQSADDIARVQVAADLVKERRLVMARLRALGVEVLEAPPGAVGAALVRRYLAIKAGGRL